MRRPGKLRLCLGLVAAVAATGQAADDPWAPLRAARESLSAGSPLEAEFVQSFTPAGFSSGESERGRIYLALPDCLRWDYDQPYPRSYLLCGETIWAWSPDESVGDRIDGVSREEDGLDFLLLSVDRLKERYGATVADGPEGTIWLGLEPLSAEAAFREAEIRLDASTGYPIEISYSDQEGNRTLFEFSSFGPAADSGQFSPPHDIDWILNE